LVDVHRGIEQTTVVFVNDTVPAMIVPLQLVWFFSHRAFVARGFRSRTLRVGQHEAHLYERAGSGAAPPVMLVHGMGGNAAGFLRILSRLSKASRRVILLELPGHGRAPQGSKPATIAECAEVLRAAMLDAGEPVVLVGSSLGGALSLSAAAHEPALVKAVVGLNPAGAPLAGEARLSVMHAFRGGTVKAAMQMTRRLFARPPRGTWLVSRGLAKHWASAPVQQFVAEMQTDVKGISPATLKSIRAPVLILWGDADALLPSSFPDYFAEHLGASKVERLPGVGHLPMQEAGREVSARLVRFLRELPA
jgi:pimeloyl-ACP methyl ester carboxylesterase